MIYLSQLIISAALLGTLSAASSKHPTVQGNANQITLDLRGSTDYYGPLYVGSEYREVQMFYDTASPWILINNEGLENAALISNYDVEESNTAKAQYLDEEQNNEKHVDLSFGSVDFYGVEYKD